ncbi:MAG: UPF0149 family protein [Piscirickettsiaceae bacterium]|nr:UPF0149 family protein [Piscirickettsiaceae bacterium]
MSELYFPSLTANNEGGDGPANASELQGALCGLLCLNSQANRATWFKDLYEDIDPGEEEILDLTVLFDQTVQSLNSLDFDLQLELPDDNAPLPSRILAMTDWCQGLVYGLGASGLTDDTELSDDSKEYIADVINISRITDEELEDSDSDEVNYEELIEYLRMGLFLIYGELQPPEMTDHNTEH